MNKSVDLLKLKKAELEKLVIELQEINYNLFRSLSAYRHVLNMELSGKIQEQIIDEIEQQDNEALVEIPAPPGFRVRIFEKPEEKNDEKDESTKAYA